MNLYLDILGRCPQKQKMERFANDVINSFFTNRFSRSVYIDIQILRVIDGDYAGLCMGDRESVEIELSRHDPDGVKYTVKELAQNLAHELVHAKQYIKGQIDGYQRYRQSTNKSWTNHEKTPYMKQPWEKEAYKLEEVLVERFWDNV